MNIRLERPEDEYTVENLTREAFWKIFWGHNQQICEEHLLVHRLRKCRSFIPELNFIAETDGKIVGHIIYTKSNIVDEFGTEHEMLTFGPLSVLPEYQSKGIGNMLMRHTFSLAKQMGYRAVIIFGHPDYYPRVGFRRAAEFGITTPDGQVFDPFMVYPLYDGALDGITGRYFIDPVYESLTQMDMFAFDKKFPAKALFTPLSIDVLLERLQPAAKEAISHLNCETLTVMITKSEREISMLAGIDEIAVETIRSIMHENGYAWGV